jgi:hypothetical protein
LELADGHLDAARAAADEAGVMNDRPFAFGAIRSWVGLVEVALALGQPAVARARLEPFLAAAAASGARAWEPDARRLMGETLLAEGHVEAAQEEFRRALEVSLAIGQVAGRERIEAHLRGAGSPTAAS